MRGATVIANYGIDQPCKFQSTHPMRGATSKDIRKAIKCLISIHAPHEGCDCIPGPGHLQLAISIHAPHEGCDHIRANSGNYEHDISIHAPHEGCDPGCHFVIIQHRRFQSTHPMRGATVLDGVYNGQARISIHAPHEGCDVDVLTAPTGAKISIHAPHEGCDTAMGISARTVSLFQSTHPMRGATLTFTAISRPPIFQSTHPMRGATKPESGQN